MIAEILVDVKAKAVDRTFDYKVPLNLENVIEIGQRVKVPFGPRFIMGYVLHLKEKSDFERLRNISSIMDLIPTLTEELIEIGKELRVTNTSPLVSIYQAMLPTALKSKYKKVLTCKDTSLLPLDLALKFNRYNEAQLTKELDPYLKQIKQYINESIINLDYRVKQVNKEQYIKKIKLLDSSIPLRGEKQKQVVQLLEGTEVIPKLELMKNLNLSNSTIKTLVDKGVIEELSEETYREVESIYAINDKQVTLNDEQEICLNDLKNSLNKNEVFLLHGITGSGKTEIYLNIIEEVVKQCKEAIMLVPEISLTPMMVSRFKGRFNDNVALLHSRLSVGEKYDEWRKIRRKEVQVVVGARSAIFAPFENLGVIIIDEEHTDSYKQETTPNYHAKDVALLRSKYYNIPIVLGSATPSIDSYYKALNNEYKLLEIKKRANRTTLPEVFIEDMRFEFQGGNRSIFSRRLQTLIEDRLEKKEQIILLLNRRGHSTFVMCRTCGEVIMCPNCDISLTYHDKTKKLKCHYCGHEEPNPTMCPLCHSTHIRFMGIGTEKVEEFTKKAFPNARITRMDSDTTTTKNAHEKLLYNFEHNGDILIGTQMIAKGLDFPKVTLVGVLAADMSLNLPDYKAIEKTFQLLTQVSGRAGRHDIFGKVVIQTYNPDHYAIMYAKDHDYLNFYKTEMKIREIGGYTPFFNITQIVLTDQDVRKVLKEGTKIVMKLRKQLEDNTQVLGPVLPKIARINNYYRAQIIIKYKESKVIDEVLKNIYQEYSELLTITIDKNPSLL
ncbi:Primosomal protein N' [Candidatus Izimaplasma bacterium HR1]|jgi:primosomal protein N' (replication factor Y)|uniref:primosomal protein N' n=1 Tax=Candidatus Izimoplasma sp. HR1 TaxID=1541959 RepID=UPI0004F75112|nr:Primosomal protein N' [Candidatus Izimaplasma bacterium HR1]